MGFEDYISNVKLNLTLGGSVENSENYLQFNSHNKSSQSSHSNQLLPSLTLSLSPENDHDEETTQNLAPQPSSISGISSYSYSRIKRERDVNYDEDDQEDGSRKKLRLTKEQSNILEDSFKAHSSLNPKQKQELAKRLNLRPRQVEVWFQNRRARTKLKQTEIDCELLKNYCDTLKNENTRLRKELQELKILKLQPPVYMQLPPQASAAAAAASLSLCPSCEKISGGSGEKLSRISFSIATRQQPHVYNFFTKPSAAC